MNWSTASLDQLTEPNRKITYGVVKPGDHDQDDGVVFVRGGDIRDGKIDLGSLRTITKTVSDQYKRTLLRGGELLVSLVGNPGAVAMAPQALAGANIARQVGLIALNDHADHKYVEWFLRSPDGQAAMGLYIKGAVQQVINLADLKNVQIPLPPLHTQRRIASVLSAYDDLIENNTRRIAILEEMARRLYEEWFVQFRFPGHEEERVDGRPKGWQAKELGDLATETRDAVHPSQVPGETPYVGLEHIPRRSITLNDWSTADSVGSSKLLFKRSDILFGKIRPYFHKVVIAPLDGVCSTDTIVLRPKSQRLSSLVLCCASSDAFVKHATQTSNGTKMPRADWKVLRHFPVAVPAETTLAQFNSCLEPIVGQTRVLMFKNANLRAQRDLLLPKLISGEIDVSNLPLPGADEQAA